MELNSDVIILDVSMPVVGAAAEQMRRVCCFNSPSATFGQYLRIPNLCLVAGLDGVAVEADSFCRRSAGRFRLMVIGSTGIPKEWPSSSTKL
jgi:hypothetical protein